MESKPTPDTKAAVTTPAAAPEKTLANTPSPKKTFQQLVDSPAFKEQIQLALPKHLTPERFIRVLTTATIKNPTLLICTQESMFKGIFDCAQAGLEIDGRRAHLVPFRNMKRGGQMEAVLIIDYKGVAELVLRSGIVSTLHADVVCENDEFSYDRGEIKVHKIDLRKDRGKVYAAYCIIRMKDGTEKAEVMSKSDVDRIRARSKSSAEGPWVTDYNEMAKKTVFKRASKWVPLSPEVRTVVEKEDDDDEPEIDVTPRASVAGLIGAATELPPAASTAPAPGGTTTDAPPGEATTADMPGAAQAEGAGQVGDPGPGTPGDTAQVPDRQVTLDLLQSLMLDRQIAESSVVKLAIEKGWAPKKTKAVDDIDTIGLSLLLTHYKAVTPAEKPEEKK